MSDPISLIYELIDRGGVKFVNGVIVSYDVTVLNEILVDLDEPHVVKSVN